MDANVILNGINLNAIFALSEKQGDEFDALLDMGKTGNELHDALRDALTADKKQALAATAKDLVSLIKAGENSLKNSVQAIRTARQTERAHMARVKALEQAIQYGKETMDMKPLVCVITGTHQHTVPASWKAKNAKVRNAPAKSSSVK
jgi:anti-sigma28 factor (negative regulator of flagellin synthesis)